MVLEAASRVALCNQDHNAQTGGERKIVKPILQRNRGANKHWGLRCFAVAASDCVIGKGRKGLTLTLGVQPFKR